MATPSCTLYTEPESSNLYFLQTYDVFDCGRPVKHDHSRRKQIESIVNVYYLLTPILWVTSSGQTLYSMETYKVRIRYAC